MGAKLLLKEALQAAIGCLWTCSIIGFIGRLKRSYIILISEIFQSISHFQNCYRAEISPFICDRQMKLKINKACDLSSISVLPPHSRRSSAGTSGPESLSIFGKSQAPMQLRSQQQQLQQSQQSFSHGVSSQHGLYSQFSQNSQEEALTNELRLVSQERENSVKRNSILPPTNCTREESQMQISRSSSNLMRKWSVPEYKCQTSEEIEHRIGMVETSLSRFGMILDSVQSDIMQVNKGTKEIVLNTESIRQKLNVHEDSLQLMMKGQEDIKAGVDGGFKSLSDQLKQNINQENFKEIFSLISALSEKFNTQIMKLRSDLHETFTKEIQAMACSMKISTRKQATPPIYAPKGVSCRAPSLEVQLPKSATMHSKVQQATSAPKVEMGGWTSVKPEQPTSKVGNPNKRCNKIKVSPTQLEPECRVVIESDEEIDGGFSCLLEERGTGVGNYSMEAAKENTERILRKARRRKRKYCNTIIIN
ncbi:putative recombination initiation defects 3 [Abeliophyllum distichum]|uniref:Recombination initiation defects 3 n=1 Tax=Abeliophyllum distichum TaxID=126358 RepID=A0ABD1PCF3_9LAMI